MLIFETFVQVILNGLLIGGIYALSALGFTLAIGVMKVFNMALGDFMMLSMYTTFFLYTLFGVDPFLSLAITIPALFFLGLVVYKGLIEPLTTMEAQVLLTFGIGFVMKNLAMASFLPVKRSLLLSYSTLAFEFLGVTVGFLRLTSMVFTFTIAILLYGYLKWTRSGRGLSALSQDEEAARLMGVNIYRSKIVAFGLSVAFAGAAGTLMSTTYVIYPEAGDTFLFLALVVVILGGMGSVSGALLGGLMIGIVESLGSVYTSIEYSRIMIFIIFIAVLLLRPSGLLGKGIGERL